VTAVFSGVPIVLFFVPCVLYGLKARYAAMKVILTDKSVTYMSGMYACCCCCWSETERIVPLEKITDCTWKQGCLQRYFGVDQLDIRTAAGNMTGADGGAGGADISLTGLVGAKDFRTALLRAKDERDHFLATGVVAVADGAGGAAPHASAALAVNRSNLGTGQGEATVIGGAEGAQTLSSINETLIAIKELLFQKADMVQLASDDASSPV
jgi:hypothetical protein